jgi:hypothetical protein
MRNKEVNPIDTYFLDLRKQLQDLQTTKLDLSDTFDNFMNEMLENGFQWFGLRQLDYSKPCACKMADSTVDADCKRCFRLGYLFTDYIVKGYMWISALGIEFRTSAGDISTQRKNLVIKHDRPVNKFDRVLMLDIDSETGKLRQPFRIVREFSVQDVLALTGKGGRVEFWKCSIEERTLDDGRYSAQGVEFEYKGNRSNAEPK